LPPRHLWRAQLTRPSAQGKGRITYLCEGVPERPFPPTPGLWFSNQPHEVQDVLFAAFKQCAYPSTAEMEALAAQVKAPSTAQVRRRAAGGADP